MQIICKFVTYAIYACNKLLQPVRYCMQIQLKWNYVSMLIYANTTQVKLCVDVKCNYVVFAQIACAKKITRFMH